MKLRALRSETGLPVFSLWLTLLSGKALCPYRFGVVRSWVLRKMRPKSLNEKDIDALRPCYPEDEVFLEALLKTWVRQHLEYLVWFLTVEQDLNLPVDDILDKDRVCPTWRRNVSDRSRADHYRYGVAQKAYDLYRIVIPPLPLFEGRTQSPSTEIADPVQDL